MANVPTQQVVPASLPSPDPPRNSFNGVNMPAVIAGAVLGGLAVVFLSYRLYVFLYRRRVAKEVTPYPATRPPMAMAQSFMASSPPDRRFQSNSGFSSYDPSESSSNYGASEEKEVMGSGSLFPSGVPLFDLPMSPGLDREGSLSGSSSHTRASTPSRERSGTPNTSSRRPYGNNTHNGPTIRTSRSATHLSTGAPHTARSRVEYVPPLPLGPPPGSIVSNSKFSLGFSAMSGIGGDTAADASSDDWFLNSSAGPTVPAPPAAFRRALTAYDSPYRGPYQRDAKNSVRNSRRMSDVREPGSMSASRDGRRTSGSHEHSRRKSGSLDFSRRIDSRRMSATGPSEYRNPSHRESRDAPIHFPTPISSASPLDDLQRSFSAKYGPKLDTGMAF